MIASILEKSVSRGKLWGAAYTWSEAIKNHSEASHDGCCRFIVTENGIWLEGDNRHRSYRTKLPKGAESHARACIAAEQLVQSSRDPRLWVGPRYA